MRCVLLAYSGVVDGADKDRFARLEENTALTRILWLLKSLKLTAYAILSPFESEDSGVGCPRTVVGAAAQIASG